MFNVPPLLSAITTHPLPHCQFLHFSRFFFFLFLFLLSFFLPRQTSKPDFKIPTSQFENGTLKPNFNVQCSPSLLLPLLLLSPPTLLPHCFFLHFLFFFFVFSFSFLIFCLFLIFFHAKNSKPNFKVPTSKFEDGTLMSGCKIPSSNFEVQRWNYQPKLQQCSMFSPPSPRHHHPPSCHTVCFYIMFLVFFVFFLFLSFFFLSFFHFHHAKLRSQTKVPTSQFKVPSSNIKVRRWNFQPKLQCSMFSLSPSPPLPPTLLPHCFFRQFLFFFRFFFFFFFFFVDFLSFLIFLPPQTSKPDFKVPTSKFEDGTLKSGFKVPSSNFEVHRWNFQPKLQCSMFPLPPSPPTLLPHCLFFHAKLASQTSKFQLRYSKMEL